MNIPPQYAWLKKEQSPKHLLEALSHYGVAEINGAQHNPEILKWADELNTAVGDWYTKDEYAWCGVFAGMCLKRAGWTPPQGYNAMRAIQYSHFGVFIPYEKDYAVGDVGVFTRVGGGHVGFLVGQDPECYHVLGGNQGDRVSFTRIARHRLYAVTRPPYKTLVPKKLPRLNPSGGVSSNEA